MRDFKKALQFFTHFGMNAGEVNRLVKMFRIIIYAFYGGLRRFDYLITSFNILARGLHHINVNLI
jgi:hypothetical protein